MRSRARAECNHCGGVDRKAARKARPQTAYGTYRDVGRTDTSSRRIVLRYTVGVDTPAAGGRRPAN